MKLTNKLWLAVLPAMMAGFSCTNIGYEKTKTGLEYKIFPSSKPGAALKPGDIVKFDYKITYKDSTVAESYTLVPGYDMVDSVGRRHDFAEILKLMKVGDSAVTLQLYDSMAVGNAGGGPSFMKKGEKLKTTLHILSVFKTRDSVMADYQNEMEKYKNKEMAEIQKYLDKNNIKAERLRGVFVEIKDKGTGPAADSGKLVSINYTGYTFEGKAFDSNVDSTKQAQKGAPLQPFSFLAKQQGAIQGMLEGITAFNKGGKGRLFIPSLMAYGPQGNPPVIKPNENLIFEVEVVDVKDLPQQPGMQNPMPSPGND